MNLINLTRYDPYQPQPPRGKKRRSVKQIADHLAARLKGYPDPDVCWEWDGAIAPGGYGQIGFNSVIMRVPRTVWELSTGPFDPDLEVCHNCDNPFCCNPNHLFVATHLKNMRDMERKGRARHTQGLENGGGPKKLDDDKVRRIRELYATDDFSYLQLARMFHVAKSTIRYVVLGRKWSHVK